MGGVHVQFSLHLQYHDLGALEQGIEPPTAPRAPQHKMAAHCSGCVFTVCVCVHCSVCVHFGWVKCRAQILSMGHHTWLNVTSLSLFHFHFHFLDKVCQIAEVCDIPARSHGNSYIFYEVANSYEFVRPHSYKFIRFLPNRTYFTSCTFV